MNPTKDTNAGLNIAQYAGAVLFILMLESGVASRAIAFLVGPFVICLCLFVASPTARGRWRRTVGIAAIASVIGYLFMRYVVAR